MISLTLTRRELVAQKPCTEGLALFEGFVDLQGRRHSIRIRDWTPLHSVWLAQHEPGFAFWLRERGLIPGANLTRANLTRANLYGANLDGANLGGANLDGANLDGANLDGSTCLDYAYYPTGDVPVWWVRDKKGYLSRAPK